MNDFTKRTWAEIDLSAITNNYREIRNRLPENCRFLGVVKADAYGHGAVPVASLLQKIGADYLAVSCLDEALELRENAITMPILILGHTPPEYTETLIKNDLTQTLTCHAKAVEFSEEASRLGKTLRVHIKLDTGMSRLGYLCTGDNFKEGVQHVIASYALPNLDFEGIYTHFAVSDESDIESRHYTLLQFEYFFKVINEVEKQAGITFPIRHCANTGAVMNYPEMMLDMVRPGLLLYGYGGDSTIRLSPAMRLVTRVNTIKYHERGTSVSYGRRFETTRRTRVGVIAAGYADGLPRLSSNKCSYMVAGKQAPQIGTICMDMCMIDLTEVPEAEVGSEVELFGPQNSIEPLAEAASTIPYELLCAVTKRVPRVYISCGCI